MHHTMSNGDARISLLKEAFGLHNLVYNATDSNTGLLEYGLQAGFIQRRAYDDRITIKAMNAYPMSIYKLSETILFELLLRLGIFIPATRLVKSAIDSECNCSGQDDYVRIIYIVSIVFHQVVNFDKIDLRTINRFLMCMAIILFSLTATISSPCSDMKKFKKRIGRRLKIDYFLWCLTVAMNLILTHDARLYINLEAAYGTYAHSLHAILGHCSLLTFISTMRMIGNGRLAPLIIGTPLIFIDSGDSITASKLYSLIGCYISFWQLDWRELVDWNHTMLCEAGICKVLSTEQGSLKQIIKKAKTKFDYWRLEEGLDDDGWFILLDPPANRANRATVINSNQGITNRVPSEQDETVSDDDTGTSSAEDETDSEREGPQDEIEDTIVVGGQQMVDYRDRVIYLQSRHPLLTSLAAIILIVWR